MNIESKKKGNNSFKNWSDQNAVTIFYSPNLHIVDRLID
jgi:hypothetical protein